MDKLFVFATQEEYENLKDEYVPKNSNVLITGEGYANIIRALKDIDKNTVIVNIGYCGSNSIPVGTVVDVRKSFCYHPNFDNFIRYKNKAYHLDPRGHYDCYSAGDFVVQTDIKEPVAFDMELYAICSLGFTNVVAKKIVSDNLSLHDYEKVSTGE